MFSAQSIVILRRIVFGASRSPVAQCSMIQRFLRRRHVFFLALPYLQSRLTDTTFISLAQIDSIMNGKLRQLPWHFISTQSTYNCTN
jgi:hypothetical protein